jgi:hypothetical protein
VLNRLSPTRLAARSFPVQLEAVHQHPTEVLAEREGLKLCRVTEGRLKSVQFGQAVASDDLLLS